MTSRQQKQRTILSNRCEEQRQHLRTLHRRHALMIDATRSDAEISEALNKLLAGSDGEAQALIAFFKYLPNQACTEPTQARYLAIVQALLEFKKTEAVLKRGDELIQRGEGDYVAAKLSLTD